MRQIQVGKDWPMGTHLYVPDPPDSLRKRYLAHAVEVGITGASANVGVVLFCIAHRLDETMPSSSLAALPGFVVYGIAALLTLGGGTAMYGLLNRRGENARREINIEQMGWILLTAGWVTYLIAAIVLNPTAIVGIILSGWVVCGAVGRYIALIRVEKKLAEAIQANPPKEPGADDA